MTVAVGQAGLGYWGKNLVRNFDELAELTLAGRRDAGGCASSSRGATRTRSVTESFDDLLRRPRRSTRS